jgi:hypothetical protein
MPRRKRDMRMSCRRSRSIRLYAEKLIDSKVLEQLIRFRMDAAAFGRILMRWLARLSHTSADRCLCA